MSVRARDGRRRLAGGALGLVLLGAAPRAGAVDAGTPDAGAGGGVGAGGDAVARGEALYRKHLCFACHSTDGTATAGPSFAGLFGTKQKLTGGGEAVADEAYLRESILAPGAKVVEGFLPTMPAYAGKLSAEEVEALLAFIRSRR